MKPASWVRFVGLLLVFVFVCNLSVSVAASKQNKRLSWNKSEPRNAAAHEHFKEDKIIKQLVKDFAKQGYGIDIEKPVFVEYGSAGEGDWLAVAVTAKQADRQLLITGYVNERNGQVEYATSTEFLVVDQAQKLVQVNGERFDHGNLKRQASIMWDAVHNRALTQEGDPLLLGGQSIARVRFGATADAGFCSENFVCSMICESVTSVICAVLIVTVILGLVCGVVLSAISYLYCYTEYNCT